MVEYITEKFKFLEVAVLVGGWLCTHSKLFQLKRNVFYCNSVLRLSVITSGTRKNYQIVDEDT